MDRETAKTLLTACEEAIAGLSAVEASIRQMEPSAERSELMRSLADSMATLLAEVRAPALRQHPDLAPHEELGEPDTLLDTEEQQVVAALRPEQIARIDELLLAECSERWLKVARIVGSALSKMRTELPPVPLGYCAQRVIALVAAGRLKSQGNLEHIRFSEVRLPQS